MSVHTRAPWPTAAAFFLLTACGVATTWHNLIPGIAYWDNAIGALIASVQITGPLSAALSALATASPTPPAPAHPTPAQPTTDPTSAPPTPAQPTTALTAASPTPASRTPAQPTTDPTPARPTPARPTTGLIRACAIATASYAALTIAVATKTLWHNTSGHLIPSAILTGLAALLLHTVLGHAAGSLVRSPRPAYAAPLLAVAVALLAYAADAWTLARHSAWWRLLAPTSAPPENVFTHWRPAVFHGQLAWYTGLTLAAATTYLLATRHRPATRTPRSPATRVRRRLVARGGRWLAVPLVAAMALAGFGAVQLHHYRGRPLAASAPRDLVCRDWPLTVCVHPAMRGALQGLETAAMPVAKRLAHTPGEFQRLVQLPAGDTPAPQPGVRWIHLPALTSDYPEAAMTSVVSQIPAPAACASPEADAATTALVLHWLATGHVNQSTPEARAFHNLGEPGRRAWLRTHYPELHTCQVHPSAFTEHQRINRSAYAAPLPS